MAVLKAAASASRGVISRNKTPFTGQSGMLPALVGTIILTIGTAIVCMPFAIAAAITWPSTPRITASHA